METPEIFELTSRIRNHLCRSGHTVEVIHLWSGYLVALYEWGLIERNAYEATARLVAGACDAEMYQLLADEPMPSGY